MLTLDRLKEVFHYDPETGLFIRLITLNGRAMKGAMAGTLNSVKYLLIMIDGKSYQAHRLAWYYMTGAWPPKEVDHKDLNRSNNIWTNLRLATRSQNACNSPPKKPNRYSSDKAGVSWKRSHNKWLAAITVDGKRKHIGYFDNEEMAAEAYRLAAKEYHGEFAKC